MATCRVGKNLYYWDRDRYVRRHQFSLFLLYLDFPCRCRLLCYSRTIVLVLSYVVITIVLYQFCVFRHDLHYPIL